MLRALALVLALSYTLADPALALDRRQAVYVTEEGVALYDRSELDSQPHPATERLAWGIVAPSAVAVTHDQRVFVSTSAGRIYDVTEGGDQSEARGWVTDGGDLKGLWVDRHGRLLVSDARAGVVVDASGGGAFETLPVIASGLAAPASIFETRDGRLLVSEAANGRVRDISAQRDVTLLPRRSRISETAAASRACVAALLMGLGLVALRRFIDPELALSQEGS